MKNIVKGGEPQSLAQYKTASPSGTWEQCKRSESRRLEIQQRLREDQGGLCAYCEIDLKDGDQQNIADFRVEHFHPKSDSSPSHNWHLDWHNLLACCHGGSNSDVVDANNRFTKPDYSCDVPKNNDILDGIILNPLSLPSTPLLFNFFRTTGSISVNEIACNKTGVDIDKAKSTIDKLRLDSNRLRRFRKVEMDYLNGKLRTMVEGGEDLSAARKKLTSNLMTKDTNGNWPRFFSALRDYLGDAAEEHLKSTGYIG